MTGTYIVLVMEFYEKLLNNIATKLQVLYMHACTFWYKYFSTSKSLEILLEHTARNSITDEVTYYLSCERLFDVSNVGDLDFIRQIHSMNYSQKF